MAEGQQQQQQIQPHQRPPRGGVRAAAGEIVEVQGGHIVRSTGRKDRHSKVCTAKGPRDRRVRLSAHTAIQFYDVQDRLGYDRPSKAVDWLIKNAKSAIDELAELPPWHPSAAAPPPPPPPRGEATDKKKMHAAERGSSSVYEFAGGGGSSSFLPPSLDSDAIADTIKSFFPMAAAAASSAVSTAPSLTSPIGFANYPPPPAALNLLSRTSSQNQDLRLSLQSFQEPMFHRQNAAAQHHQQESPNATAGHHLHHGLFSGFDGAALVPWSMADSISNGGGNAVGGGGGYVFSLPQPQPAMQGSSPTVFGQSQFFTQRGPLQSSNPPFVRAWRDPIAAAAAAATAADHHPMQQHYHHSIGFTSGGGTGSFSGFHIPARIQGEEEHDGGDKPSSASSGSHH